VRERQIELYLSCKNILMSESRRHFIVQFGIQNSNNTHTIACRRHFIVQFGIQNSNNTHTIACRRHFIVQFGIQNSNNTHTIICRRHFIVQFGIQNSNNTHTITSILLITCKKKPLMSMKHKIIFVNYIPINI
jgi:phage gp37-like protein